MKKINRRDFLSMTAIGAGAVVIGACAKSPTTTGEVVSTQVPEAAKTVEVSMWDSYAQPPQGTNDELDY